MSSKSASTPIPRPDQTPEANPVADFDIEAWRAKRVVPRWSLQVTNDPSAGDRMVELIDALKEAHEEIDRATAENRPVPGRRAASTSTPQIDELKAAITAHMDSLDGTWMHIKGRAVNPHESNKIAEHDNRLDRLAAALEAVAVIAPTADHPGVTQTAEQWHEMFDSIGTKQTLALEAKVNEKTAAVVTPDFSRRVSELLNGVTSS